MLTFKEYVSKVYPSFVWTSHCEVLARVLQQVADGAITRLIVQMPPRHGKSELVSRMFPAYYLYRYGMDEVGLASYSADLAQDLSSQARDNYVQMGGKLSTSTFAKSDWRNLQKGRMWAAGVDGSLTGKGFNLGIIDDAFKGPEEAFSKTQREKVFEFYQAVFYTRKAPKNAIVLIGTRWHHEDLIGRLLDKEAIAFQILESTVFADDEEGIKPTTENWHIVNFDALRSESLEENEFPSSCTVEPDWRDIGAALCPERYPRSELLRIRQTLGEFLFNSLYQQRPITKGGSIIKREWFQLRLPLENVPHLRKIVIGADLAYTKKDSADFTAALPLGVDDKGTYYLFRPFLIQGEASPVLQGIASRAVEIKATAVGIEAVAAQSAYISQLRERNEMAGIPVIGVRVDGDKEARARAWAPIAEQGLITLVTDGTGWEEKFLQELEVFPVGKHDDQVDAVSIGMATLRETTMFYAAAQKSEDIQKARAGFRL